MARVICAGHCNWDVTLRVDSLPEPDGEAELRSESGTRGGSAANAASALARLDVDVALLASVGDDDHGDSALEALRAAGVDCRHVRVCPDRATAIKYVVADAEGRVFVLGRDGGNEAFTAADLPAAALSDASHLHLTGQAPTTARRLADRAREAGVTVSFDPGRRVADRAFAPVLERADVVFLNEAEAEALPVDDRPSDAAVAVLKRGARGAVVRTGDDAVEHPGFDVDVRDTTGAGDAFAAGFIAARLDGASLEASLERANACGAVAVGTRGAPAGVPPGALRRVLDRSPRER
jgi:ribokinase